MNGSRFIGIALAAVGLLWLLLSPATIHAATTLYVDPNGHNTNNPCFNQSAPCKTIKHALSVATDGDTIHLAVGTYKQRFTIGKTITLTGDDEGLTRIDGTHNGRVIFVKAGKSVVISTLTVQNGKLTDKNGAGIYNNGILIIDHLTIRNNQTIGAETQGGGIYNGDTLTLKSSLVTGNQSGIRGGGVYNNSKITVQDTVFESNTANSWGGGLANGSSANATLTNLNLDNNQAQSSGGGMWNAGKLNLTNAQFSSNTAYFGGGGFDAAGGSAAGATLTNVTFKDNSITVDGWGGGVYVYGTTLNLTNVTFSGNSAKKESGGGLFVEQATANLVNVTFSGNTLTGSGTGGAIGSSGGQVKAKNTIIANSPVGGNCSFAITSLGHNLDSGNTCGLSTAMHDQINTSPKLAALQYNGGFADTMALKAGSPAIDKGTNNGCPSTDERGVGRPINGDGKDGAICDMGAFEYKP